MLPAISALMHLAPRPTPDDARLVASHDRRDRVRRTPGAVPAHADPSPGRPRRDGGALRATGADGGTRHPHLLVVFLVPLFLGLTLLGVSAYRGGVPLWPRSRWHWRSCPAFAAPARRRTGLLRPAPHRDGGVRRARHAGEQRALGLQRTSAASMCRSSSRPHEADACAQRGTRSTRQCNRLPAGPHAGRRFTGARSKEGRRPHLSEEQMGYIALVNWSMDGLFPIL